MRKFILFSWFLSMRAWSALSSRDSTKRLAYLLLFTAACLFAASVARLNFVMHDMYHELSLVREAMIRGELPLDNPFAFTPTVYPSVHHEWAMGLLLHGFCITTGWGLAGLTLLRWMLIAGVISATYMTARRRGADPMIFALLSIVVLPIAWVGFGTLRAQLVTLFFTAIQLRLMDDDRRGGRAWVLLLLPMWMLWVNIHAGFLVGIGLVILDTVERVAADVYQQWRHGRLRKRSWMFERFVRRYWHRLGILIAAVAILRWTPYGGMYAPYVLHAISLARPEIAEWGPLWTTYRPGLTLAAFAMMVGSTSLSIAKLGWRRSYGTLALIVTAYLALRHIRHGSIFGVVWMCYATGIISQSDIGDALRRLVLRQRFLIQRVAIATSLASLVYFLSCGGWYSFVPVQSAGMGTANQPAGIVQYLKANGFRGRLMTPFGAGAYVMWHMYPDVLISIDGRYEVGYPPDLLDEHRAFYRGEMGWEEMLQTYPCDAVVIPQESPIIHSMQESLGWRCVYQDDTYILMTAPEYGLILPSRDRRGKDLPQDFL